jgi:hypothetical protein
MLGNTTLHEGSKGNVFWEFVDALWDVEVVHIPVATGDSWVLRDKKGKLHYVQKFQRMDEVG